MAEEEKNNILYQPCSGLEYVEFVKYCNKNDLIIEDKGQYFEGIPKKQTLLDVKQYKKALLKENIEDYFYKSFPLYKQNNIAIFGTAEEKKQFKSFHHSVVKIYDKKAEAIDNCETIEELDKIEMDF